MRWAFDTWRGVQNGHIKWEENVVQPVVKTVAPPDGRTSVGKMGTKFEFRVRMYGANTEMHSYLLELGRVWHINKVSLCHCGLVTADGDRDLGQHWLR